MLHKITNFLETSRRRSSAWIFDLRDRLTKKQGPDVFERGSTRLDEVRGLQNGAVKIGKKPTVRRGLSRA